MGTVFIARPIATMVLAALAVFMPALAIGQTQEFLSNGSFELGPGAGGVPFGWHHERGMNNAGPHASFAWAEDAAHQGLRSISITAPVPPALENCPRGCPEPMHDAEWLQVITLEPERNYLLSGWIKTEAIAESPFGAGGASLCAATAAFPNLGRRTTPLAGTNDWTNVRIAFNSGPSGTVRICAHLGFKVTGTAWFDDLRVTEIDTADPHPQWKMLVLIYDETEFAFVDEFGTLHHVAGRIDPGQLHTAADAARRFAEQDVPALTSGNMIPALTVRYPGVLSHLSPHGGGWWPSPSDTVGALDPAFDSVIVIWQPTVTDVLTGEQRWIGSAAGLALPTGAGQTYATIIVEAATTYGHRNVFKHEWGHAILGYYDAAGITRKPAVENHTDATTYVHCGTAEYYVWEDETDANPIYNSIYNNESGFTHDYYSGTTALAYDPMQCLGITPAAWATGGPVTVPGTPVGVPPPPEQIEMIRRLIRQLVDAGALRASWSRPLAARLDQAGRALGRGDALKAAAHIERLDKEIRALIAKGRLEEADAAMLRVRVGQLIETLTASHVP